MNEWNPRLEILAVSHRWYLFLGAFLIGSLLGWVFALAFPTAYRAETEMYVAYNADSVYRNPDDYKNWQLGELEAFVYSDGVIEETLRILKGQDPAWNSVTVKNLRSSLQTYWRNAGKWRMVAERDQPEQAVRLAEAWSQVVLERTNRAIRQGQRVVELANQIRAITDNEVEATSQILLLEQTSSALSAWRQQTSSSAVVDTLQRWRLQSLAAGVVTLNPVFTDLLNQFPAVIAKPDFYLTWVDQFLAACEQHLEVTTAQRDELAVRREILTKEWKDASTASRSLTAYLTVEQITEVEIEALPVRMSSQAALVGGVLGLLLAGFLWLYKPVHEARR